MSPALVAAVAAALAELARVLMDHSEGKITESEALARVAPFTSQLAADDAAAQAAEDAKFGKAP